MDAVDIAPVAPARRTQPAFDLFLIFAGANIVATTIQTGASLASGLSPGLAMALIAAGTLGGSALIAALARVGPALGVPSMIAARAALGRRGAGLVALLLIVTNFAWIAVNNAIAASACARVWGGPGAVRPWAAALGALSTLVVAGGPRLVARADRLAVPLLAVVGVVLTAAALRLPAPAAGGTAGPAMTWTAGLDVVAGYQVSWILMFADYSRYTASRRQAGIAVFLGLGLTSLWLMPVGLVAARAAGSTDPGAMLQALGLGVTGAVLMAAATVTTNFVNIYMSALAVRSVTPGIGDQAAVWATGLAGAALGLYSGVWLDRYASFMVVLGGLLVPVGGILFARFFLVRGEVDVASLYARPGDQRATRGFDPAGLAGWAAGGATYYAATGIGGTLPSLLVAVGVYLVVRLWTTRRPG